MGDTLIYANSLLPYTLSNVGRSILKQEFPCDKISMATWKVQLFYTFLSDCDGRLSLHQLILSTFSLFFSAFRYLNTQMPSINTISISFLNLRYSRGSSSLARNTPATWVACYTYIFFVHYEGCKTKEIIYICLTQDNPKVVFELQVPPTRFSAIKKLDFTKKPPKSSAQNGGCLFEAWCKFDLEHCSQLVIKKNTPRLRGVGWKFQFAHPGCSSQTFNLTMMSRMIIYAVWTTELYENKVWQYMWNSSEYRFPFTTWAWPWKIFVQARYLPFEAQKSDILADDNSCTVPDVSFERGVFTPSKKQVHHWIW